MAARTKARRVYDEAFKAKVVTLAREKTSAHAARKFKVRADLVSRWRKGVRAKPKPAAAREPEPVKLVQVVDVVELQQQLTSHRTQTQRIMRGRLKEEIKLQQQILKGM